MASRYRDSAGKEHSRHFGRKVDAQQWLDSVTTSVQTGTYTDPRLSRVTIGDLAERWLDGQAHLRPSTRAVYGHILRRHVLPRWAPARLADVSHSDVQGWVSELSAVLGPEAVRKTYRVLSLIMTSAVRDGRIARNPCDKVNLPRPLRREQLYLDHGQVHALAGQCGDYRLVVLSLAYLGLRRGEMAALRVGRIDFLRRRLVVAESVTLVDGVQTWGAPKSYERREVPVPKFLADLLAAHVVGKSSDDLVFSGNGPGSAAGAGVPARSVQHSSHSDRVRGPAPARSAAHRGIPGDRVGRLNQGGAGHARACLGDGNFGQVRAPLRRPVRRSGGAVARGCRDVPKSCCGLPAD